MTRPHPLVLALALAAGCAPATHTPRSSGSLGLTSDDGLLYVADADHDEIVVLSTQPLSVVGRIAVGRAPERILVAPDDTVYVSLRGERAVARIDAGTLSVAARAGVGGEPVGLALSGSRLLVANASSGTVSILHATTLVLEAEVAVGGIPWAVAALPNEREAYVTDQSGRDVAVIDLDFARVTARVALDHPALEECPWLPAPARTPAQPADVVIAPDGQKAYVAHVLSRTGAAEWGNGTLALAVAPALSTVSTTRHALVERPAGDAPSPLLVSTDTDTCALLGEGMDAPSSLVVDPTGRWIYVADHNSNALAIVTASGVGHRGHRDPERGIVDLVRVGARPTGLAVRGDLEAAYVHSALDYEVAVVGWSGGALTVTDRVRFAVPDLPPPVERGRRLFYSAVDPRVTRPELGGVSCSSCHPEGRTDGLSWFLGAVEPWTTEVRSPRNTPPLWNLGETSPYGWDGTLRDLHDSSHVMVAAMGGAGLTRDEADDVSAFLRTIPPPDNPRAEHVDPVLFSRGERLFAQQCESCHGGAARTDGRVHGDPGGPALDTPGLSGLFATAPYLHDGSAGSLHDVLAGGHGGGLDPADAAAMVAFLEAL